MSKVIVIGAGAAGVIAALEAVKNNEVRIAKYISSFNELVEKYKEHEKT